MPHAVGIENASQSAALSSRARRQAASQLAELRAALEYMVLPSRVIDISCAKRCLARLSDNRNTPFLYEDAHRLRDILEAIADAVFTDGVVFRRAKERALLIAMNMQSRIDRAG